MRRLTSFVVARLVLLLTQKSDMSLQRLSAENATGQRGMKVIRGVSRAIVGEKSGSQKHVQCLWKIQLTHASRRQGLLLIGNTPPS